MSALRELLVQKFISHINDECATLCRKSGDAPSLFRKFPVDKVDSFSLEKCIDEVKVKASALFKLLVTRSDHRNKTKKGAKKGATPVSVWPSVCCLRNGIEK